MFVGTVVKVARQIEKEKSADLFPNKHESYSSSLESCRTFLQFKVFFSLRSKTVSPSELEILPINLTSCDSNASMQMAFLLFRNFLVEKSKEAYQPQPGFPWVREVSI